MFSDILKELRAKSGMSQGQLAKAVGVSAGNVSDWEVGKTKPGYVALSALARFLRSLLIICLNSIVRPLKRA